ncbi:hypothetical protein KPH14_006912 [Odynerus spinipes]|uniref:Uncharacterized protein n=1 Tax=Odynerus spinipes TaxID=1348599 RepID=A0AAD9RSH1_9HYME|nr:hypothetical protein KPH14_006912 [Odynerus spinipes]
MNKSLVEKSRNFYVKTYLQKSITTWKAFVLYKKEKNMFQTKLIEKVSKLYNSNLLHKYFMIWISLHNSTKVFNEQLQMVLHHYNKKVLNRYFLGWVAYYNTKKQNKDVLDRADQQYRQKLLKRCLKQFNLGLGTVVLSGFKNTQHHA